MNLNKHFIKGVILGLLVYLGLNVISLLLALPIFLGYYFAIVFMLIGGFLYYFIQKKRQ